MLKLAVERQFRLVVEHPCHVHQVHAKGCQVLGLGGAHQFSDGIFWAWRFAAGERRDGPEPGVLEPTALTVPVGQPGPNVAILNGGLAVDAQA